MRKTASVLAMLLPLALLNPQGAQANPLGVAADYNVFVFGDIEQWGTDVEGRVAAGGTATYGRPDDGLVKNGFAIASKTVDSAGNPDPTLNLVVGNTVVLQNGSVGWLDPVSSGNAASQKGNIVYGAAVPPIIPTNVGYGMPPINGHPIDFAGEEAYLKRQSAYWRNLIPTSGNVGTFGNIKLVGNDPTLNVFGLSAADFDHAGAGFGFFFEVFAGSTVLVNVSGLHVDLKNFGSFFNGIEGEPPHVQNGPEHYTGYPYSSILFNFFDATSIAIDGVAINGSILAPLARIDFGKQSHIDGNLIAASLTGQGESHNFLFSGNIPTVPEPATLLLFAAGIAGMVVRRRRG